MGLNDWVILTSKEHAKGKPLLSGKVVISNVFAAQMCVASVGDKVTNTVCKQGCRAVCEYSHVSFVYEIAERIFVLRNHLCNTRKVGSNDPEVIGDCHSAHFKEHNKRKPPIGGLVCSDDRFRATGFTQIVQIAHLLTCLTEEGNLHSFTGFQLYFSHTHS